MSTSRSWVTRATLSINKATSSNCPMQRESFQSTLMKAIQTRMGVPLLRMMMMEGKNLMVQENPARMENGKPLMMLIVVEIGEMTKILFARRRDK